MFSEEDEDDCKLTEAASPGNIETSTDTLVTRSFEFTVNVTCVTEDEAAFANGDNTIDSEDDCFRNSAFENTFQHDSFKTGFN
jgi:hypothetical protein